MISTVAVLVLVSSCLTLVESQQDFAAQYHIQTDLGADRFFRFQTHSGQYRKEILRPDGSQEGTYGWVDPNGVLRLFDYIADNFGYRIVKESLFKVGAAAPGAVVATRSGDIELGFEVYPLDGAPQGALPASRLHLTEGSLGATPGYSVASLTSTSHHLDPNPLTKHEGATFFSGAPLPPPPPPPIVVGHTAEPVPEARDNIVVGHTGNSRPAQEPEARTAPARGNGIVIGLSNHGGPSVTRQISRQAPAPAAPRRNTIVIGSTRRRRSLISLWA